MKRDKRAAFTALALGLSLLLTLLWLLGTSSAGLDGAAGSRAEWRPAGDTLTETVYLPLTLRNYPDMALNLQDRQSSLDYFQRVYCASEGAAANWTGDHASCDAGTTAADFRDAVLLRINYYRAMAGVPATVLFSDSYNPKAQEAALMMSANNALNHYPPSSWICYTADGYTAAGKSNLCRGCYGPGAIDMYMMDWGPGNDAVGHRRWILYPQTQEMGTGDVPYVNSYPSANALWVFDLLHMGGPRPETRDGFVAWPPPGYVPYPLISPRWSFSYPNADFSSASVTVSSGGNVPVTLSPVADGYGENTLVWELNSVVQVDTVYSVSVTNVLIDGSPHNFTYNVSVFDPGSCGTQLQRELDAELGVPLVYR